MAKRVERGKAGAAKGREAEGDKGEERVRDKEGGKDKAGAAWVGPKRAAWPGTACVRNAGIGNRTSGANLAWSENAPSAGPR